MRPHTTRHFRRFLPHLRLGPQVDVAMSLEAPPCLAVETVEPAARQGGGADVSDIIFATGGREGSPIMTNTVTDNAVEAICEKSGARGT